MGRPRKPLKRVRRGRIWVVKFRHPLTGRTTRINLGETETEAGHCMDHLNGIWQNPAAWRQLPEGTPQRIKDAWTAAPKVTVGIGEARQDGELIDEVDVGRLASENAALRQAVERLGTEKLVLERKLEALWGRKVRKGPSPTLRTALDAWLRDFKRGSPAHRRNVTRELERFVHAFGSKTLVDDLSGQERRLDAWLADQDVVASRRQQIRIYVLRFLDDSGLHIDRKKVPAVKLKNIRSDRKPIRWLSKARAVRVAEALPNGMADAWRVQVALGLRPTELITLQRSNFSRELSAVTLAPLGNLTLKTGPRTIQVPKPIRDLIRRRLESCDILFPDEAGEPYADPRLFWQRYNRALAAAGKATAAPFGLDARTGRRTCASILLRAGRSTEEVAILLGDRAETIREHYARLLPVEVDPSAAALEENDQA